MAGLHLAGIAVEVRPHFLCDGGGIVQQILERCRRLEPEFLVDILAVDHDEDGDIIGHADPAVPVFGDAVDERRHEVVDIVVRHGESGFS